MSKKIKYISGILCFGIFIVALGFTCLTKEPVDIIKSENRPAAEFPEFSIEAVMDKSFFDGVEEYLADQFPLRDGFRNIKATVQLKILGQKDNNGNFIADGHVSKINDKLNEKSVEKAANKLNAIYDFYLKDKNTRCYYSIVPDKNYFIAEKNGYPALDYGKMTEIYTSEVKNMTYINLFDTITIDDYYTTDSHWKQEKLGNVVAKLGNEIGFEAKPTDSYDAEKITDFQGVYARQLAVGNMSDELYTLNSDTIRNAAVYSHGRNTKNEKISTKLSGVYDISRLSSPDKYDVFLSGMQGLLTVENPNAPEKRELVVFRDSFGSSLTPLLIENYSKITLIDMRYVTSGVWGEDVDFKNCDVLFIFSPDILNQSHMLMS